MLQKIVLTACVLVAQIVSGFIFSSGNTLGVYNVDKSQISISGISSGGAMTSQMHVIHSKMFMGAGIIAGVPFACSGGVLAEVTICMQTPSLVSVTALTSTTEAGDAVGNIDDTSNMADDKIYIFDGKLDSLVRPSVGSKIESFYRHFIADSSNIKTVFNVDAEHGQPTENYGGPCDNLNTPDFLNNCNYSAAFDLLNFIHGENLRKPTASTRAAGELKQFSQSDFFYLSLPSTYSMDTVGYVYVPTGCQSKSKPCKLHVALHGCSMGRKTIGDAYVKHSGYNEVGEINDIIILYPQVIKTVANLAGCWDWWGYTGPLFATKSGFQITALKRMIDKISGQ